MSLRYVLQYKQFARRLDGPNFALRAMTELGSLRLPANLRAPQARLLRQLERCPSVLNLGGYRLLFHTAASGMWLKKSAEDYVWRQRFARRGTRRREAETAYRVGALVSGKLGRAWTTKKRESNRDGE